MSLGRHKAPFHLLLSESERKRWTLAWGQVEEKVLEIIASENFDYLLLGTCHEGKCVDWYLKQVLEKVQPVEGVIEASFHGVYKCLADGSKKEMSEESKQLIDWISGAAEIDSTTTKTTAAGIHDFCDKSLFESVKLERSRIFGDSAALEEFGNGEHGEHDRMSTLYVQLNVPKKERLHWNIDWSACREEGRPDSRPFVSGDGFRCIADHVFDETTDGKLRPPLPVALNRTMVVFVKTELLAVWFSEWHSKQLSGLSEFGYILISHNSDESPVSEMVEKALAEPKSLLRFYYGQNLQPGWMHKQVVPVPLGLENARWKRQYPEVYRKCRKDGSPWSKRPQSVLMSFNPNREERKLLVSELSHRQFVHVSLSDTQSRPFVENLAMSKYVLSPRGNGLDCHRTWEALACGSVPILKTGSLHESTLGDAPVVWVNTWGHILSGSFLEAVVKGSDDDESSIPNVLRLNYWMQHIASHMQMAN